MWLFTKKLDGVQVNIENGKVTGRSGSPLYNFEDILENHKEFSGIYELFRDDFEKSVSLCSLQNNAEQVKPSDLHNIIIPDPKLVIGFSFYPNEIAIKKQLRSALARGYEGLVLIPCKKGKVPIYDATRVKVKPRYTVDVRVTGYSKKDKLVNCLITEYGMVSTGLSLADKYELTANEHKIKGMLIEVEIIGWTNRNLMRNPKFLRIRLDKDEEDLACAYFNTY